MDDTRIFEIAREAGSTVIPMRWSGGRFSLLDQRLLPAEEKWNFYENAEQVAEAIRDMVVRGAPAIGITAAFGMVLAAREAGSLSGREFLSRWDKQAANMIDARPTAVNLKWAVDRLSRVAAVAVQTGSSGREVAEILEEEAMAIWEEDIRGNLEMGRLGAGLLPEEGGVLTHCNAGALATGGYGTALGVIRAAVSSGRNLEIYADETRPWFQGSRLTAWELIKDGMDVTLLVDNAAGLMMKLGKVNAVVVGSDRITANGDVANKIGTYQVAVLARRHNIPFIVAAPVSTIDPDMPSGDAISIEERQGDEIVSVAGTRIAAQGVKTVNMVFDVTPAELVTAIVTEREVLRPPYGPSIQKLFS